MRGEAIISKDANDDGTVDAVRFEGAEGDRPVLIVTNGKESAVILERIDHLIENEGFKHTEIGVLVLRNRDASLLMEALGSRNIPTVNLVDLRDGPLGNGIRVGTFDRAKGMEFRAVFIPRVGQSRFPIDTEDSGSGQLAMLVGEKKPASTVEEEDQEARLLNLDRLYVAMTRARDRLCLIADEQPCDEIQRVRDYHFD